MKKLIKNKKGTLLSDWCQIVKPWLVSVNSLIKLPGANKKLVGFIVQKFKRLFECLLSVQLFQSEECEIVVTVLVGNNH